MGKRGGKGAKARRAAREEGVAVEVGAPVTIPFKGADFVVAESVGLMPLMRFAYLAKSGVDSEGLEGLAAMYSLLQSTIADDEWDRFVDHASKTRADNDDLMAVVNEAIGAISGRPTVRPSVSSGGPSSTNVSSVGDSSSAVVRRLEQEGRPSIALMVQREQDSRASA